jgi:hypothetical protein
MRTLKDFSGNFNSLIYGPAVSHRFSGSCAYVGRNYLNTRLQGGVQFAVLPVGEKVSRPIKSKSIKVTHKKFKLKSGDYLHFDFMSKLDGAGIVARSYNIRNVPVEGTRSTEEFISFSITYLGYLLDAIVSGPRYYDSETRNYKRQPPATKEELQAIKNEFRAIVKGKLVGIIFCNESNTYYKPEEILEKIRSTLGLFKKKPRFSININNTVHPKDNDYLTFQLYQY